MEPVIEEVQEVIHPLLSAQNHIKASMSTFNKGINITIFLS